MVWPFPLLVPLWFSSLFKETHPMTQQHSRAVRRIAWAALALLLSCRASPPLAPPAPLAEPSPPIHLTLVGTNDLHGWVLEQTEALADGELKFGGLALLSSYVEVLRGENPGGVVLVDAGDLFQGTLVSNMSEGAVVVDALNRLGYDAASIGNHEFDYGPVGPAPWAIEPSMDPFGALKARIAQARFPLLSSNIYEKATGLRPSWLGGDGSVIVERLGVKVGLFGLTTPQTPTTTLPINVATLRFGSLAPEAMIAAQRLRAQGADVVVAVVHAGGRCHDCLHPHDLSSCDLDSAEVFEMMRTIPEGTVDAVVAGHTHAQIGHFVNGAPVIESWALGRGFGVIDLFLDPTSKKVLADETRIQSGIEVCETAEQGSGSCNPKALRAKGALKLVPATFHGHRVQADSAMVAQLQPAVDAVASKQDLVLGVDVPHGLGRNYEAESALGSFLADSLRAMTKADVALLNPGGLRADLKPGPLTYGRVYEVMPFDNQLATLDLNGEQLKRVLVAAYGSRKGVFQISGVEVMLDRCQRPDRLKSIVLANGRAVEPRGRYRVVMPDFLARGGDGLGPALSTIEKDRLDLGDRRAANLRDELVQYWQAKKEPLVPPRPGRVGFVETPTPCQGSRIP